MPKFAQARTHMVDSQIHTCGVVDPAILHAFNTIPRELFVPEKKQGIAYHDDDLDLGQGRFLLEPATHARMLQAVNPHIGDIVLDIGCATGYSSAILAPLVTTVIALESNKKQLEKAVKLWDKVGACNIVAFEADLKNGAPQHQPFSLIILNGAVAEFPLSICDQLIAGGRMVVVVRPKGQVMGRVIMALKDSHGGVSTKELFDATAPYIAGFEPQAAFEF